MSKKAVLVGINYYGSTSPLEGCINDVNNMKAELITQRGYKDADIVMLCDDRSTVNTPTKQNILNAIQWLCAGAKAGDRLFFGYCGHGSQARDSNGDEEDGLDETICPVDYTTQGEIKDDQLRTILVNRIPKGVKLFCVFDSCHSGSVLDLKYTLTTPSIQTKAYSQTFQKLSNSYAFKVDKRATLSAGDVVCVSGCRDDQTSADTIVNGKGAGAMTWAFLTTVRKYNGLISYAKLLEEMRVLLKSSQYDQIPQLSFGKAALVTDYVAI